MSANHFNAAQQIGCLNHVGQSALAQANGGAQWQQQFSACTCRLMEIARDIDCPIHGARAQINALQKEDIMDRNPTDRATALECLKLAVGYAECTDAAGDEVIIGRAEAFYSFVTGQPTASVADAVVEAVKDAVKGK